MAHALSIESTDSTPPYHFIRSHSRGCYYLEPVVTACILTRRRRFSFLLVLQHLPSLIPPSRPLRHLFQRRLFSLLVIHPARLHSLTHQVLVQLLERQQLPLQVSTMNAIGIIRILRAMIRIRRHRPATTLTLTRERHKTPHQKPTSLCYVDNHTWTIRRWSR